MPEKRVIVTHKDGRSYSVLAAKVEKLYPASAGWKVTGEEKPSSFVIEGVPAPKAPRGPVRAKGKGSRKAAPARPLGAKIVVPEPEHPKPSEVIDPPVAEG